MHKLTKMSQNFDAIPCNLSQTNRNGCVLPFSRASWPSCRRPWASPPAAPSRSQTGPWCSTPSTGHRSTENKLHHRYEESKQEAHLINCNGLNLDPFCLTWTNYQIIRHHFRETGDYRVNLSARLNQQQPTLSTGWDELYSPLEFTVVMSLNHFRQATLMTM